MPAYGRFPSAQLLVLENRHLLIDCGEGTQMQLSKANASPAKINHIFISHLHGDHYLGLPGLIFSMHLNRREADLHIYSFRGLDEVLLTQFKHSQSVLNFRIIFHEIKHESAVILDDELVTVTTLPMKHKIPCVGFLFQEKPKPRRIDKVKLPAGILLQHIALLKTGQDVYTDSGDLLYKNDEYTQPPRPSFSYAYCTDTSYQPELVHAIQQVDWLYHESTFMESEKGKAVETRHSTAREAAQIARDAGVKKLILGHFSARYRELNSLLEEARAVFPASELATECLTFEWTHETDH